MPWHDHFDQVLLTSVFDQEKGMKNRHRSAQMTTITSVSLKMYIPINWASLHEHTIWKENLRESIDRKNLF